MLDRYTNGPSVTSNYYPHRPYPLQEETEHLLLSMKEGAARQKEPPEGGP